MKPTYQNLLKVIAACNRIFTEHHFILIEGFCPTNFRVVDTNEAAIFNFLSNVIVCRFYPFSPSFEIVTYQDVDYLALNVDVK